MLAGYKVGGGGACKSRALDLKVHAVILESLMPNLPTLSFRLLKFLCHCSLVLRYLDTNAQNMKSAWQGTLSQCFCPYQTGHITLFLFRFYLSDLKSDPRTKEGL